MEGMLSGVKRGPEVLIVDDTPINLSLMSELLEEWYEVRWRTPGKRRCGSLNPIGRRTSFCSTS